MNHEPYYCKIGQEVEVWYEGEWHRGKIVNGYRFKDGIISVKTEKGGVVGFGTDRYREFLREVKRKEVNQDWRQRLLEKFNRSF